MAQAQQRTATAQRDALAARDIGAAEVMADTLQRISAANRDLNAIVGLRDADDLMAEARACDTGPLRGPLHGMPIAVKDLVNVAGVVSTHGSPHFANTVPDSDDLIAARMRAAGAILIGKTNVPEFGLGSHTFNPVYGATRNPYDRALSCGGSSGGAAVALAAGLVDLADGSDMMGSLRNPAGWNNVYGFRPSWGRVPSTSLGDTFLHQLATLGPMARSPRDLALLLDVIAGPDPAQPHGLVSDPVGDPGPVAGAGLRIGWLGDWGGAYPMEPGILDLSEAALGPLADLGAQIEVVDPPFSAEAIWDSWVTLRSWAVAGGLQPLRDMGADLKDTAIWEIERGMAFSAMQVHAASVVRSDWFRAAAQLFERFDALVLPTAQVWPFPIDLPYPETVAGQPMDTYHRWMEVVVPVSLLGLPCLGMPAGFGQNGLPGGIQLFGPRGSDAMLLGLGQAYHEATRWPDRRPPQL